jgi:hypothetical protein
MIYYRLKVVCDRWARNTLAFEPCTTDLDVLGNKTMTDQEAALVSIAEQLEALEIPYMVIGGMANAIWGEPRATLDVDVTVWVDEERIDVLTEQLAEQFTILPKNPAKFIRQTRVLPMDTEAGVRIDMIFGIIPFEHDAIRRSVRRKVAGRSIHFCTAEDLIIHKIISEREQDQRDWQAILRLRSSDLDRQYLDPRIRELSDALERPEIWSVYQCLLTRK